MNLLIGLLSVSVLIFATVGSQAKPFAEGGNSGGGSDYQDISHGSAWFLGPAPITYCIESSAKFGVSAEAAHHDFESAVVLWKNYVSSRRIHSNEPPERKLGFNFQYTGDCHGDEALRILLGVTPQEVVEAKKRFDNPFAFAIRESYDPGQRRGKGFIWFANTGELFPNAGKHGFPNWPVPNTLHGMFLHEIGHTLGLGHTELTIMAQNMMSTLQMAEMKIYETRTHFLLRNIDDQRLVYLCQDCPQQYAGKLSYSDNAEEIQKRFRDLFGRDPIGSVSARFQVKPQYQLAVADSKEEKVFVIETSLLAMSSFSLNSDIFGIHFQEGDGLKTIRLGNSGIAASGSLITSNGKIYPAQVSINASGLSGPVRIAYHDGKEWQPLFFSRIGGTTY